MASVIVIGAGMGGLSAAIRLRMAGHEVDVLEANPYAGGKLSVIETGAYRFDAGPSLFTQPSYHADLFTLAGKRQQDYFTYSRLSEVCHYFWADGTRLTTPSDPEALALELERVLGEDAATVRRYLHRSREKFAFAGEIFLNRPLQKLRSYRDAAVAKAILRIGRLQMFESLHHLNARTFRNPKTVQLFDRYATYNGSDPYRTSALYSMIPSFEHGEGAYFPTEGMASIGTSLVNLAEEIGVRFHLSTRVEAIHRVGAGWQVQTKDETRSADALISNADITHLYRNLMPEAPAPEKALSQPLSTSAVVFYWGISTAFPELGLHNIFFSEDYQEEFKNLFDRYLWPDDPTIYVNISSKEKPDDAPPGCENWFVMVNVPARTDLDTPQAVVTLRVRVLATLSQRLGQDIESLIKAEEILTPSLLARRTSGWQGALYGSNSNSLFSGFWRHPNFSDALPGLFFTGGTVHPGGGIPLALKSGQIAAGLATEYLAKI